MSFTNQSGRSIVSSDKDTKTSSKAEDECCVDSGILSGENLSCEQYDSEEVEAAAVSSLVTDIRETFEDRDAAHDDMRLDSGVDVGLTDSFSGLHIENAKRNDLSGDSEPFTKTPVIDIHLEEQKQTDLPPWQIYFQQDDDGDTQLHIAIIQGFTEAVWALLAMCPHPSLLNIRNDAAQTPLHLAVLTAQPQVVRRLVLAGAMVNCRDCDGNTPLHLSAATGDVECLKALANPPLLREQHITSVPLHLPTALDQKNYDGETPVHLATMSGHIDLLKSLVWYGADINAREGKSGFTALHMAVELNNVAIASYLIGECRGLLPGVRNYAGRTARRIAKSTIVDLLPSVESDDDYDSEDDDDYDSYDEEVAFGDDSYFRSLQGREAINVI